MTRALAAAAAVLVTLAPGLAAACPACISSPYGDRSYNWAYVGLLLAPFLIATVIGGVLAWSAGYRLDVARLRRALSLRKPHLHGLASPLAPPAPGASASHHHLKETT